MKIVITGPECSGKSTLSNALATKAETGMLDELSRTYLNGLDRPYNLDDIIRIAHLHVEQEDLFAKQHSLLILDTDLITLEIWTEEKFGVVPEYISDQVRSRMYDHYLLCSPDFPWEYDPLRENPNDRDRIFDLYYSKLIGLNRSFSVLEGPHEQRLKKSLEIIQSLLKR
jgi:nicotinamide riboside kinase